MECQRSDSIGRRSAILKKPPAMDSVDNKTSPIIFGIGQKLPAASKCKDATSDLAEGHHSGGQSPGCRHYHSYGATDTFTQPEPKGQADLLSCGPNDHHHKHIHRVFQVNRVVNIRAPVCHSIVKKRKRKFL